LDFVDLVFVPKLELEAFPAPPKRLVEGEGDAPNKFVVFPDDVPNKFPEVDPEPKADVENTDEVLAVAVANGKEEEVFAPNSEDVCEDPNIVCVCEAAEPKAPVEEAVGADKRKDELDEDGVRVLNIEKPSPEEEKVP
jgi:hypothetical protein